MSRINILSKDQYNNLYAIPKISSNDKMAAFELDHEDQILLNQINNISAKINFILQLAYFRISQYFFVFTFHKVIDDTKFILATYFPDSKFPQNVSNKIHYANRGKILQKYNMKICDNVFEQKIAFYAKSLIKEDITPKYIFDSIINYCHLNSYVRLPYSKMQDIISLAISNEKIRINNKLYSLMTSKLRLELSELMKKEDLFYYFTTIKIDQKNFKTFEIRGTIEKHKQLYWIYHEGKVLLRALEISEQNFYIMQNFS